MRNECLYCVSGKALRYIYLNRHNPDYRKLELPILFFYDFNLRNFVVQIKRGESRLYYIDLKSFDSYKPWTFLHLEKISNTIARRIMAHRLKRLLMMIGIID